VQKIVRRRLRGSANTRGESGAAAGGSEEGLQGEGGATPDEGAEQNEGPNLVADREDELAVPRQQSEE